jgi:hypothetical protein
MMMFGGVPMRVTMPQTMVAKDSGMRVSAGLRLAFEAASMSTGISSASAATLFITADSAAPTPPSMPMWAVTLRDGSTTYRAISSMAPEFESPLLTTSTSAIMMVAGWPKPANAC